MLHRRARGGVPSSCATSRVAESYIYHCIAIEPSLSLSTTQSRDNLADIFTEACKVDASPRSAPT